MAKLWRSNGIHKILVAWWQIHTKCGPVSGQKWWLQPPGQSRIQERMCVHAGRTSRSLTLSECRKISLDLHIWEGLLAEIVPLASSSRSRCSQQGQGFICSRIYVKGGEMFLWWHRFCHLMPPTDIRLFGWSWFFLIFHIWTVFHFREIISISTQIITNTHIQAHVCWRMEGEEGMEGKEELENVAIVGAFNSVYLHNCLMKNKRQSNKTSRAPAQTCTKMVLKRQSKRASERKTKS